MFYWGNPIMENLWERAVWGPDKGRGLNDKPVVPARRWCPFKGR